MQEMRTPFRMLAAVVAVAALAACSDDQTAGPTGPDRAVAPVEETDTAAVQPPADGDLFPGEKAFLAMAKQVPGYAGDWYDGGTRVVALTDPNSQDAALRTLSMSAPSARSQHDAAKMGGGTRFVAAQFDYLTLRGYRDASLETVLSVDGATYMDLDERANRVVVGITDESRRADVEARFKEAGVPAGATRVVVTGKLEENTTLQQAHQPLEGGWQIQNANGGICTLGFTTSNPQGGAPSFVTASHCTSNLWRLDGTWFSQPVNNLWVGREVRDPRPFGCFLWGFIKCRYSDAALVQANSNIAVAPGLIARTEFWGSLWGDPGSIDVDAAAPTLAITGVQQYPLAGDWVDKMGRTTGWTTGQVQHTCVTVVMSTLTNWALCQYSADHHSAGGDSGAPVFVWQGNTVTLAGLHWGRIPSLGVSLFSPIGGIQNDLGVP
jgi:hypothetical protein